MAKSPIFFSISWGSQALPALAYFASRRRSIPAAAMVIGASVSFLANVISRVMAILVHNNHVVTYISSPITATCFLYALREWQLSHRERQVIRVGTFVFLVAWVLLVAFVEDVTGFDLVTGPLYSLTLLVAAAWTLIRRAGVVVATPLPESDWFWVCLGLSIYGASTALADPIGGILLQRQQLDLFYIAWSVRAVFSTLSFLLISWGIYLGPAVSKFATVE
jgi:hypothetical protein